MVEKKLYKTKLCMLYQRGRCSRQFCNFAHGSAELRRSFDAVLYEESEIGSLGILQFANVVFSSSDFPMNDTERSHPNALFHFILQCVYSSRMWYFLPVISSMKDTGRHHLAFLAGNCKPMMPIYYTCQDIVIYFTDMRRNLHCSLYLITKGRGYLSF